MNREDIKEYIKGLEGAYSDMPFDFETDILRRADAKWFGTVLPASENYFKRYGLAVPDDRYVLCLKCPPDLQIFLREKYPQGILPAYHMNKKHWISVILCAGVPDDEIKQLIELSYNITAAGKIKR